MDKYYFTLNQESLVVTLNHSVNMVGEQILRMDNFYGHDYGKDRSDVMRHMCDLRAQWASLLMSVDVDYLDTPELNFYHEVQSVLQTWIIDKI